VWFSAFPRNVPVPCDPLRLVFSWPDKYIDKDWEMATCGLHEVFTGSSGKPIQYQGKALILGDHFPTFRCRHCYLDKELAMRRGPKTANELMEELEADPEFRLRKAKKEKERLRQVKQNMKVIKPLFSRLKKIGVRVKSIDQLMQEYAPFPIEILEVLLRFLQEIQGKNSDIEGAIAAAIGASRVRYDGRILAALFDSTDSSSLKWTIGNTFSISHPTDVGEWCLGAIRDKRHDRARQMLCVAVAKLTDPEPARQALREVFDDMPGHVAMGLAIVGDEQDLGFLQEQVEHKRWVQKEMEKAVRKIEKRCAKERARKELQNRKRRSEK
jgi:hypothetical protein